MKIFLQKKLIVVIGILLLSGYCSNSKSKIFDSTDNSETGTSADDSETGSSNFVPTLTITASSDVMRAGVGILWEYQVFEDPGGSDVLGHRRAVEYLPITGNATSFTFTTPSNLDDSYYTYAGSCEHFGGLTCTDAKYTTRNYAYGTLFLADEVVVDQQFDCFFDDMENCEAPQNRVFSHSMVLYAFRDFDSNIDPLLGEDGCNLNLGTITKGYHILEYTAKCNYSLGSLPITFHSALEQPNLY